MPPPQFSIPRSAAHQHDWMSEAYIVLEQAIRDHVFPGAAFAVLANGEIRALDGIGRFTYDSASSPVSATTIYDLASVTKVLATTSMAMLLYDRAQLPLDAPVVHWLPGFADRGLQDGRRDRVTIRMLLTHSSGLPGYARLYRSAKSPDALFDACLQLPLEAPPGQRYAYSDPGFILLGRLLEKIAGEPLDCFCAREVFEPLGMTSTRFRPPADWRSSIPPTEKDLTFRHRLIQGEVQDENCFVLGGVSGHAGLFSNAFDPLRLAMSLLGSASNGSNGSTGSTGLTGSTREERPRSIFSSEAIRLFTTRQSMPPGSSRALGWDTPSQSSTAGSFFSPRSAGHLGYSGTSFWIDFDAGVAVTLLTNRTWPARQNSEIRQVRRAFHDAVRGALRNQSRNEG